VFKIFFLEIIGQTLKFACMKKIFLFLSLMPLLAACGHKDASMTEGFDCVVYEPVHASGFNIKKAEGYESVLLTAENPWQGASDVKQNLLILRGGEGVPDGFEGCVLREKACRIAAMSSTQVAMLDAVGMAGRIVAVSGLDFISTPSLVQRRDSVADIGFEGNVNYELLLASEPDIVLLYGVNSANSMENKLKELGLPYFYVGDYLEESPLGKAEWLVALAEIAGVREHGEKVFAPLPERYEAMRRKVAEAALPAPKVMINAPYGDAWFMPPSGSYAARLIADAGGELSYKGNTGNTSVPIDMEDAYMLVSEADVWLNPGTVSTMEGLREACPKMADAPCVVSERVFNNNRRMNAAGGNDYFESAVVHPDIVLRDLVKILHPVLVDEDFVYYRRLK